MIRKLRRIAKRLIKFFRIDSFLVFICSIFNSEKVDIGINEAEEILSKYSPEPNGSSLTVNEIDEKYDCHVIVPVYNTEKYIKECIDSIVNQETEYSYLITVINDGSTDKTGEILKQYVGNQKVEIIEQENKGFSGARNTGLKNIRGKYVCFVDADDVMPKNALQTMITYAEKESAEIVQGGYYRIEGETMVKGVIDKYSVGKSSNNNLTGFAWGKVFRNYVFKNLRYPENYWYEDSLFSFLIFPQNYKSVVIPDIVYYYRDNQAGISRSSFKYPKCIDTYYITKRLLQEYVQCGFKIDRPFQDKMMRQYIINGKRIVRTPIEVQKAVFVLTCELHKNNFINSNVSRKYRRLDRAIRERDYGYYAVYCKHKLYGK